MAHGDGEPGQRHGGAGAHERSSRDPVGMVEQELQADGAADRDAGVGERRPRIAALLLDVADERQDAPGQLGDGEWLVRHGPVFAA